MNDESMNILVIESSPHKNGSSNLLADNFIRGAEEKGHQVTVFDAACFLAASERSWRLARTLRSALLSTPAASSAPSMVSAPALSARVFLPRGRARLTFAVGKALRSLPSLSGPAPVWMTSLV